MNGGTPIRSRFVAAVLLAAVVWGGSVALERRLGPRELVAGELPAEISGALFCPHGGGERWRVWLVLANPGDEPSEVRVTTYGASPPSLDEVAVAPGTQTYVEVPAAEPGSASAVEYFGARVAAGMVMTRIGRDGDPLGRAAEPCVADAASRWYLPEGSTERGQDVRIVVMNPFPQEAAVSLWVTDEQATIKPGTLAGLIIPQGGSIAADLGDVALGKTTVATTVDASLGRVVVGAIGISEGGLRASSGVAEPSTFWALPGAGDDGPTAVPVHAPGRDAVPFRMRRQSATEQIEVVNEGEVEPGKSATLEVEAEGAGLVVAGEGEAPFVAARRLQGPGDLAATAGVPSGRESWVALPATSPSGGEALLFVQNPGDETADVRLAILTETGPAQITELSRVTLRPGSIRVLDLASVLGSEPVSVVVTAESGAIVAGQAASGPDGYALAIGVPMAVRG